MKYRLLSHRAFGSLCSYAGMGFALLVLVLLLFLWQPALLRQLNLKIYDHFLLCGADSEITAVPLIVDIDEASLAYYGQWPWPRYRLALLVQRLLDGGVLAVGLDIVLAEADRTSPDLIQKAVQQELGIALDFSALPDSLRDHDALLARSIQHKPVVLGAYMRFGAPATAGEVRAAPQVHGVSVVERSLKDARPALQNIARATGLIQPVPVLVQAAPLAFFNMGLDQDGLVRRIPVLLQTESGVYANLALRTLMAALKTNTLRLTAGVDGLERLGVGKYSLPIDPDGSMLVPYRGGARTFPYVSASAVLNGRVDADFLRGRIAFIGTSAAGLLDLRSTPLDRYTPGVEVHATVLDALLSGHSLQSPSWNTGLQAVLIILLGAVSLIFFSTLSLNSALVVCIAILVGLYVGAEQLFMHGLFITPFWGMLAVSAEASGIAVLRLWRAERDKRQIRSVFGRYVSPEVVSRIVESRDYGEKGSALLRGEERKLTIMFTDLRGFTALSETLQPEQVVRLLNAYFTPMTALVRQSRGTLDKFIGDALMAFWNAPLDVPDHPTRAVEVALDMQETLHALNGSLEQEFGVRLAMGIGLHTGMAHVGNMGSHDLTSYTALGDSVNLASRLEALCSRFGVSLVMSGETAEHCPPDLCLVPLARLRVKGRIQPVAVFTALRLTEARARAEELELYTEARIRYQKALAARDPEGVRQVYALFKSLALACPERMLYAEYAASCLRCAQLVQAGNSQNLEEWSDVWTLNSK